MASVLWKAEELPCGGVRISPHNLRLLIVPVFFLTTMFLILLWNQAEGDSAQKWGLTFIGVCAIAGVIAGFTWWNRREQKLGAFFVLSENKIQLRNDTVLDVSDFDSFKLQSAWEFTSDGQIKVWSLVLRCKSGAELKVLDCAYHREVAKLKTFLEGKLRQSR